MSKTHAWHALLRQKKPVPPGGMDPRRFRLILVVFCSLFAILTLRAILIQLFPVNSASLESLARYQYQQTLELAPHRGTIYDHRLTPLAVSIKTPSLAVNPRVFAPDTQQAQKLKKILHITQKELDSIRLKTNYFAWLKRTIPYETAEAVKGLNIEGIHFVLEPERYYPNGSLAANLLGIVGLDQRGQIGLEYTYDRFLKGTTTSIQSLRDGRGRTILTNRTFASPTINGYDLVLTIDHVIQKIVEDALREWREKSGAQQAFAVVSDPHTGKILAMASYPTFNPQDRAHLNINHTPNLPAAFAFEPGSVMKVFPLAAALEKKYTTLDEIHDCEASGRLKVSEKLYISDEHPRAKLSTAEVLVHSSNICTYKIAQRLGPQGLYEALQTFGFGTRTKILGLAGENAGRMEAWQKWSPIRFSNIAFGQGLMTTALEVAQAYGAFANGGFLRPLYLIERIQDADGRIIQSAPLDRGHGIISPKTSQMIRQALFEVVEGAARLARLDDFSIAGKTGTAEKADPVLRSYPPDKRIASFVGLAPASHPHLVIYVVIDEPRNKPYYGGTWAAPAFAKIADQSLRYLNVARDKSPPANSEALAVKAPSP